jgi:hypothetical protein
MSNWIQLKDGVAFANVESQNPVGNSILMDSSVNWKDVIGKKYQDGNWVEAPLIYFVEESFENKVIRVNSTVFSSDVTGPICSSEVNPFWIIETDGTFSPPATIGDATIYDEGRFPRIVEEDQEVLLPAEETTE